nr:hypothetical protein [Tanacetum cinerariifolium]
QFCPKRSRVYSDLTPEEKDRYNADIWATNILLQGLPKDIYTLINHYTNAKDIWDNGESIHDYYVRFAKLIKDMRNIKMTMSRLQLNSKFVNNMLPEWGRFVTAVKLNRGLRDSNYDQLHPYLKQHETHTKENKMMLERFSQPIVDPLALLSNISNPHHYSSSSSALNQATVQDDRVVVQNVQGKPNRGQGMNPRGGSTAGYGGAPNRVGNVNPGQARPGQARPVKCYNWNGTEHIARNCTQPKRPQNSKYYKDKMLLMQAQENRVALDAEQLLFLAGGHDNAFDDDYVKDNEVPFVHSDASSIPTDAFMMIYNDMCESHDQSVSNPSWNTIFKNSLTAELATYKEHVKLPKPHYNELNKVAIGYKNPLCLTRAKQVQPALYNGYEIIKENHTPALVHNTEDTLEIAEIIRKKMNDKMNDPEFVTRKVKIAPHDYSKENFLATFTSQKQLTAEQIFEIKDMKDVFEELKAEVAQYAVDRKHDAIERKNLLIANDNLIAKCFSQEVFSVATNSELNVARLTEMHFANTTIEARCLALEAKLANLRDTNNHDNQKELINHFSKLEEKHAIDVKPIVPRLRNNRDAHLDYLRHLKESVETIRDIVEEAKVIMPLDSSIVYAYRYTKHSQELLEYAIGTCR